LHLRQQTSGSGGKIQMEHTVEKLSGNKVKISFKVPAATFDEAIEKAYIKKRSSINMPGFRRGKAPRKLIERMYGEAFFYDDAMENLIPEVYQAAVEASDLKPVAQPELEVQEIERGKDLIFSCEVFVKPDVKLGEYKDICIKRILRQVTQEEVDAKIAQEQKRVSRSVEVTDRPVIGGDQVNLDYTGTVDGNPFDGGVAHGQTLLVNSGSFIPGFEEQLIGLSVGEERDIHVTFPAEYHSKDLQGKNAVFHVKVNGIIREELPELDDEFASEVSDFDTFQAYYEDTRNSLKDAASLRATEDAKQSMVQTIVSASEIDLPDPMVDDKLNEMIEQMSWRMRQQGLSMKTYLEIIGQDAKQMRDMYREEAINTLKVDLVLEQIIKEEDIQPDANDVEKILLDYANALGKNTDSLELSETQKAYFEHRAKIKGAIDLMWSSAKITDEIMTNMPADDISKIET